MLTVRAVQVHVLFVVVVVVVIVVVVVVVVVVVLYLYSILLLHIVTRCHLFVFLSVRSFVSLLVCHLKGWSILKVYKCIADDTKAAARQSQNCINKTKNTIWRKTIFNMADGILTPCNVACGSGIMTVNSPGGSTL